MSQGCGFNWTCDPYVQAPACTAPAPVSPFDSFRLYSLHELSRDTGSTLDINAVFSDPVVEDLTLVNGQHQPVIQGLRVGVPVVLRVVGALGGGIVVMKFPAASAAVCRMTVLAYDGVYLRSGLAIASTSDFRLVEGGRADVQVVCETAAVHDIVYSGSNVMLQLNVTRAEEEGEEAVQGSLVTDDELAAIVRPDYLLDLTGAEVQVDSPYSVAFWQDGFNHSSCGAFSCL